MANPSNVFRDAGPAPASATFFSHPLTVTSVTNGCLFAEIGIMDASAPVTVLTLVYDFGGAAIPFTFYKRTQNPASLFGCVEIWYLPSPPVGTFNIRADFSNSVVYAAGFSYYQDVNQGSPFRNVGQTATGTGTAASLVVNSANGDIALDAVMFEDFHNITITGSQTSVTIRNNCSGSFSFGASDKASVGATTTNSWNDPTSSLWIQVGGSIQGTSSVPAVPGKTIKSQYPLTELEEQYQGRTFKAQSGILPYQGLGRSTQSRYSEEQIDPQLYSPKVFKAQRGVAGPPAAVLGKTIQSQYNDLPFHDFPNGVVVSGPSPAADNPVQTPVPKTITNIYYQELDYGYNYPSGVSRGRSGGIVPGMPTRSFESMGLVASLIQGELDTFPKFYGVKISKPAQGGAPIPPPNPIVVRGGFVGVGVKVD